MMDRRPISKELVARSFHKGMTSYGNSAVVQKGVAERLVEMLCQNFAGRNAKAFEIGCSTGNLTELLVDRLSIETLFVNDLVADFYAVLQERIRQLGEVRLIPLFGDIEKVELPDGLDLVVSSATLQWLEDLPALFSRIAAALTTKGVLAFSIFGPGTLTEFREVTGIGLSYHSLETLKGMLAKNFTVIVEDRLHERIVLKNPREVLRHLQKTGVSGVQDHRWTPATLRKFEQDYSDRFAEYEGVPVSYESFCIIARKKRS